MAKIYDFSTGERLKELEGCNQDILKEILHNVDHFSIIGVDKKMYDIPAVIAVAAAKGEIPHDKIPFQEAVPTMIKMCISTLYYQTKHAPFSMI